MRMKTRQDGDSFMHLFVAWTIGPRWVCVTRSQVLKNEPLHFISGCGGGKTTNDRRRRQCRREFPVEDELWTTTLWRC
jgi:hypothetical protein